MSPLSPVAVVSGAALVGSTLLLTGLAASAQSARPPRAATSAGGEQIFRQRCAGCHGPDGQGGTKHPKPLAGTKSAGELAAFIARNMPPRPAARLSAEQSRAVARYVYDAFYSPVAQARLRPPRVELARLTARQYRAAVADLVGSFRPPLRWGDQERGLRAQYFRTGSRRRGERLLERIDPQVRFDFGTAGAVPGQDDPYTFSMTWEGSVVPTATGEFEFIVRTEHAVQLWVNDLRRPLIDALVKSGSDNEYRASIFLLEGRPYSLRLEFSKGVVGVNDLMKLKEKPPLPATLALEWRPPGGLPETIPQRRLLPIVQPEAFAVATPFPPDDRSMGYERGASVSREWDQATTEAAIETANYVAARIGELAGAQDDASDREAKARDFCRRFAERAFRRPLSPEDEQLYVHRRFDGAPDLETAVKRVVMLVLKSPRFLYREPSSGKPDPHDVASRLSFGLWDSLPDAELLRAAAAGELASREQAGRQAERMLADPRARIKLNTFLLQWLKLDQVSELSKDPKRFPDWDRSMASDLRTSFELTLEAVVWSEASDYRQLLLGQDVYLNGRLAKLYGVDLPPNAPFQPIRLDPDRRAGIVTHPYLLASQAYLQDSSPIHRGVLLARNVLGRVLLPPQAAFVPLSADQHPNLTTRERVALQTSPKACRSCHALINELGFALEGFDAVGRVRTTDAGKPVDTSGSYTPQRGPAVRFKDARDLAAYLAGSSEAHAAFVEKLFHHLVGQPVRALGPQAPEVLRRRFVENGFNIRRQVVETFALSAPHG